MTDIRVSFVCDKAKFDTCLAAIDLIGDTRDLHVRVLDAAEPAPRQVTIGHEQRALPAPELFPADPSLLAKHKSKAHLPQRLLPMVNGEWMEGAAIVELAVADGINPASVSSTLSVLHRAALIDRSGKRGAYSYRRRP